MNQRIYHGNIQPLDLGNALLANFHRGNFRVQQVGDRDKMVVQIATSNHPMAGGQTALSVILQKVEDGVAVEIGQQAWLGVAASLGASALSVLRDPFSLLNRLDDIAQDIESLQLTDEVFRVLDLTARSMGGSHELSERLKRIVCGYCNTANPVGQPRCIACGAPMGDEQPSTCLKCGFVIQRNEKVCPNCGSRL